MYFFLYSPSSKNKSPNLWRVTSILLCCNFWYLVFRSRTQKLKISNKVYLFLYMNIRLFQLIFLAGLLRLRVVVLNPITFLCLSSAQKSSSAGIHWQHNNRIDVFFKSNLISYYSAISIEGHFWSLQKLSLNWIMTLNWMILCSTVVFHSYPTPS